MIKNFLSTNDVEYRKCNISELETIIVKSKYYLFFNSNNSESIDILRHIRNGIAHGRTKLKKEKGTICIYILDFNKEKKMSAQIHIPLNYIEKFRKLYKKI